MVLASGSIVTGRGESTINEDVDGVGLANGALAEGGGSKIPEANRSSFEASEAGRVGSRLSNDNERRHDDRESDDRLHAVEIEIE